MRGTAAEAATYEGEVDRRLAALRGKPADATPTQDEQDRKVLACAVLDYHRSREEAQAECDRANEPMSLTDIQRASLLAQVVSLAGALSADDLRVLVWILERLPFERLRERCTAITLEAAEPAGRPNNWRTTPHDHVALAGLLSAWRGVRLLVLGPTEDR